MPQMEYLLYPIVLDGEGQILDGRNRLTACQMAKVKPDFTTYEGGDPAGFAVSANIIRRHLSKGQQAMILVKSELLVTNKKTREQLSTEHDVKRNRLSYASMIQQYAPELVEEVIRGDCSPDAAYRRV